MKNYDAWKVDPSDFPTNDISRQLEFLCHYGLIAPSVHNTQPWNFAIDGHRLRVGIDDSRRLDQGDPTGRETWISLGCCVENILLAAGSLGLEASVDVEDEAINLRFSQSTPKLDEAWLTSLVGRVSNRHLFAKRRIEAKKIEELSKAWKSDDIQVVVTANPAVIKQVAELTGRGIGLALSLPQFKTELAELMRPNWTKAGDGMPGFVLLNGNLRSIVEPWRFRHLAVAPSEAAKEKARMATAAGLILVFSRGDTKPFWLESGRAYEHLAVLATKLGLSQSTTAAAVEAPDFHQEIEAFFKTDFRLQTIMRIGYCDQPGRHSPRLSLEQLLTSTS